MNLFGKTLALASIPSVAMLFASVAQAMEIRQFDKMADRDQSAYTGNLIIGAENVLTGEGKSDLATRFRRMFTTEIPGDADAIGMVEFEMNLAPTPVPDAERAEKHRPEVEDAMLVTQKRMIFQ